MKHLKFSLLATPLLAVSLVILQCSSYSESALARGGGGGGGGGRGGGGGGGFRGGAGGFGRGDFGDRGMGDRGWGDGGYGGGYGGGFGNDMGRGMGRGMDRDMDRGDNAGGRPAVSDGALRQGANQNYHWSNLPTDGVLARGADHGVGGANRITRSISAADMATRGLGVRNSFRHYDLFNRDFWGRNRDAWWYPGWGDGWPWGYTGWGDLCGYWGYPDEEEPVEYDYGNNITYQDDSVYYGDQPMESAGAYYDQAQVLATSVPPSVPPAIPSTATKPGTKAGTKATAASKSGKASDWKPLGVFALTQGDQTDSNSVFQLAVNKTGVIRGNYYNPLTQEEKPVQGKVDMKNKRVAWTVGSNKTVVYDTGLANLLAKQSSLLIHLDKNNTQQWNLVRLQQPQS